jgi:hypothetical protein
MGSALPSDPRIGRILEAWVSSERENKTAAPDRYILDDFELALPNSKYRSGMLTSATTKALKEQWPDVYETVIRAAVNNAVDQGLEIDPYTLRDRAILEAQTRFVALRFGAVQAGNNGKWANCPLQKMLSLNIYERFSEQLGARRFRRDQPLESILSASDYYQAFTAAQLEHAAEMQVSLRRQPARLSSYRCRDALIRLLEVKVAIKASERAHARDRGISNSGHEEALQLHALAAGIKSGHTVYKQEVTGSTTFRVWTEKVQEHYTSDKENLRDFDTAVAGDIEAAGIYIKALKTAVSTGNDRLEQDRFEILQLRLANFDDALTGRDHNVDALTEQRVLAEFEPGAIDAQAALQLLDQQSGD